MSQIGLQPVRRGAWRGPRDTLLLLSVALAVVSMAASGQSLSGTVLAGEDMRALPHAFVVLLDQDGEELAATLSDARGHFEFDAASGGAYRLRAELVGRSPHLSPPIVLANGSDTVVTLVANAASTRRPADAEFGGESCSASSNGEDAAALWSEVQKVLRIVRWTSQAQHLLYDAELMTRVFVGDEAALPLRSTIRTVTSLRENPFNSLHPTMRTRHGNLVVEAAAAVDLSPDAGLMLHEDFVSRHCFSLVSSRSDTAQLIGVSFATAPGSDTPGLRGIAWASMETLQLHHIEFRHEGIAELELHRSLGGIVWFERALTGEWFPSLWTVRVPEATSCDGTTRVRGQTPMCLLRIIEHAGRIVSVRRKVD